MVTEDSPGILDFQDAMQGPLTYDLVSLLKDCYVKMSPEQIAELAGGFAEDARHLGIHNLGDEQYLRCFDLTGVQRHLKAAGIFARLNHRDGKPGYLADVPRTLSYIVDLAPRYGELSWLADFIGARVLPGLESPA
jgi:aminoglycoside/choline kinase family phosphotransferase